jgi:hypothetical protein
MYSLGIQHQLAPAVVAAVQYAGSTGWRQSDDRSINTLPLVDPVVGYVKRQAVATDQSLNAGGIACTAGQTCYAPTANLYRQYPGFSTITQEESETNFGYNSLQMQIRMEAKHGFSGLDSASHDGNFGQITSASDPRRLQLGAKLSF